jgi:hypothetical protein
MEPWLLGNSLQAALDLNLLSAPLDARITFTRAAGPATYYDSTGTLQAAGTNVPRFGYDPVTLAPRGLLLEESRTNLLFPSGDPSTAFTTFATTTTANSAVAPDGTTTATRMVETATTAVHYVQKSVASTASTTYALSVFAKAQEVRYLQVILDDNTNGCYATFDLQTGTITGALAARGTGTATAAYITPAGNGWYRCTVVGSMPGTTARCPLVFCQSGNPGYAPSYAGNASNGMLIWGTQLEAGAFQTSYIPTTGASATRAVDVASMSLASWFSASQGTFATETMWSGAVPATTFPRYIEANDGTVNNYLGMIFSPPNNQQGIMGIAGVAQTAAQVTFTPVAGSPFKVGLTYTATARQLAVNGSTPASQSNPSGLPTLSTLSFGNRPANDRPLNGYIRRVRYWSRALSAVELQQVTR